MQITFDYTQNIFLGCSLRHSTGKCCYIVSFFSYDVFCESINSSTNTILQTCRQQQHYPRRHPAFTSCINPDLSNFFLSSLCVSFSIRESEHKCPDAADVWKMARITFARVSITLLFLHRVYSSIRCHHYILMVSTRFHCDLFVQTRLHDFDGWHLYLLRQENVAIMTVLWKRQH